MSEYFKRAESSASCIGLCEHNVKKFSNETTYLNDWYNGIVLHCNKIRRAYREHLKRKGK